MRIASKLITGYICIALLIVLAGFWIGMETIQTIEKDFSRVTEETVPMVEAIEDLKFASMRIISSAHKYAFIHHLDGEIKNELLNEEKEVLIQYSYIKVLLPDIRI